MSGTLPRWPRHTGHRILLDTGAHPDTVLRNFAALKIDIAAVNVVILSHHHLDHPAGLVTLRETLAKRNPEALSTAHVATSIFANRFNKDGAEGNPMMAIRTAYEQMGSS